jgi:hypothetical protein
MPRVAPRAGRLGRKTLAPLPPPPPIYVLPAAAGARVRANAHDALGGGRSPTYVARAEEALDRRRGSPAGCRAGRGSPWWGSRAGSEAAASGGGSMARRPRLPCEGCGGRVMAWRCCQRRGDPDGCRFGVYGGAVMLGGGQWVIYAPPFRRLMLRFWGRWRTTHQWVGGGHLFRR